MSSCTIAMISGHSSSAAPLIFGFVLYFLYFSLKTHLLSAGCWPPI
jgi:hypothetical protein